MQGIKEGQTHVDNPTYESNAYWAHPVDIHYSTKGLQGKKFNNNKSLFILLFNKFFNIKGWPKFNFQVWHQDSFGRIELYGYGSCHVPVSPGYHEIECATWRPMGSIKDQITSYFVGGSLQLKNPDLFNTSSIDELFRLKTVSMGKVHLRINVILRNFEKYGVEI